MKQSFPQRIPVNLPRLNGNEKDYLIECIETGWISSEGAFVHHFEERFAATIGRAHGVAVSNGTAALDVAIAALGIGEGDEVILPSFTIISCVHQIVRSGAIPVLVDSDPDTWNMDVTQIKAKITSHTRAIMAVHIYGLPVDMDPLLDLAARHGIALIEDAAEMHGQTYRGRPCGSFGDISTFSFYPNKLLTTGEGGMVVTDRADLAESSRSLRNLCFQAGKRFVHERLGWNYRMTNMQAAVGIAQLEQMESAIARKREIGAIYMAHLNGIEGLQLPKAQTDYADNIYWVFGVVLDEARGYTATEVMAALAERGVDTRPFFCPMHLQPVLRGLGFFDGEPLPVSERLYRQGFYLPSGLGNTDEHIERSAELLREVLS